MTTRSAYLLTQHDLNQLKEWFSCYAQSFYTDNPLIHETIVLKEQHSLRVCDEILNIGRRLNLSANHLRLAEAIALFHDVGRFEQFTRHRTFVDAKSQNHAQLGVNVLRAQKTLAALNEDTQEIILKAVAYHNRISIPEDESPACLYFSKLIRDADKLDILNLFADHYYAPPHERSSVVELDLPDTPGVSDDVITCLEEGKMIKTQQLQSLNDFKLLQMAWIYDINFRPTFQMIQERGYLEKIKNTLPSSEKIDAIYKRLVRDLCKHSETAHAAAL